VATGHREQIDADQNHALEAGMKRYITLAMFLVLLLGISAVPVVAQMTGIKGATKDQEGKPITDGVVEVSNTDTGRKITTKTNKNGEYTAIGLTPGNYDVTLMRNDKQVDAVTKVPVSVGDMREVNFDLKKDLAAKGAAGPTEEQLKKQQENTKQNEKIKGLNARLADVRDLEKAGNYDQAVSIMQEITTAEPNKDLLWAYLGEASVGAKKYPEAIDAYQQAIKIKPDSALYHSALANAYNKANQPDKAIAEYTQAAQMDPANAAGAYFNIGIVNYNASKSDDAVAAFDKAIQLDPNRADAYYYKGMALLPKATLGKDGKYVPVPGTVEAFQKYLELKPDGPLAQTAKETITMLGSSVETTYGKQKAPAAKKKPN
jgi:tetratricopeptide (TPR) repeat protein